MVLVVKNSPAHSGDPGDLGSIPGLGRSLAWDDPLEKGMATHSCILAWRIPWTGEPGGLQPMGSQRVRLSMQELRSIHFTWRLGGVLGNNNFPGMKKAENCCSVLH